MRLDSISDYPCSVFTNTGMCHADCHAAPMCRELPIYRAHRALREAVLGDMTTEEAAEAFWAAGYASDFWGYTEYGAHVRALAAAVAGL